MSGGEKIRKLLDRPLIRATLKSIPFVGDIVGNMDNDTPKGEIDPNQMWFGLVRLLILGALAYFALSGKINWEEAGQAKELIGG